MQAKYACCVQMSRLTIYPEGKTFFEVAANRFAAELLLPRAEVARLVRQKTATISVAKTLSAEFESSLTAAALKAVDVTEEECAVVWSEEGLIEWCHPNDNFRPYIRVHEKLSSDSLAAKLMRGSAERELDGSVPAQAWVNVNYMNAGATIWEDSIHLPYYQSVLTILTITKPLGGIRHEDDAALEELNPHEFTIGRRRWPR
jgi:IrrE N-terminal-like domain